MCDLEDLLRESTTQMWGNFIDICIRMVTTINRFGNFVGLPVVFEKAILMSEFNMQHVSAKSFPAWALSGDKNASVSANVSMSFLLIIYHLFFENHQQWREFVLRVGTWDELAVVPMYEYLSFINTERTIVPYIKQHHARNFREHLQYWSSRIASGARLSIESSEIAWSHSHVEYASQLMLLQHNVVMLSESQKVID